MGDRKNNQIRFHHENSGSPTSEQHPRDHSYLIQKNARQMTLDEFRFIARQGVKSPNVS
jgi:hypothetical protein